jgi:hypothetical protein
MHDHPGGYWHFPANIPMRHLPARHDGGLFAAISPFDAGPLEEPPGGTPGPPARSGVPRGSSSALQSAFARRREELVSSPPWILRRGRLACSRRRRVVRTRAEISAKLRVTRCSSQWAILGPRSSFRLPAGTCCEH